MTCVVRYEAHGQRELQDRTGSKLANEYAIAGLKALGWGAVGAALGAAAGGLFGVLFGTLDSLIRADPGRSLAAGVYFALCGAAAGAVAAAFTCFVDAECLNDLLAEVEFGIGREGSGHHRGKPVQHGWAIRALRR
jgi:hypothetical protein